MLSLANQVIGRRRENFRNAIARSGAGGPRAVIDFGDKACVASASTQDIISLEGSSYNFYRGSANTAAANDPTFNGNPGGLSRREYFSFDGGDYCRRANAVPSWEVRVGRDAEFWAAAVWFYPVSVAANQGLFGNWGGSAANNGWGSYWSTGSKLVTAVASGTNDLVRTSTASGKLNAWNFFGVTINENGGATASAMVINGTVETFNGAYSAPGTANPTYAMEIGAIGNAILPVANGTRIACVAWWENTSSTNIPTSAQLVALYQRTRGRFGV